MHGAEPCRPGRTFLRGQKIEALAFLRKHHDFGGFDFLKEFDRMMSGRTRIGPPVQAAGRGDGKSIAAELGFEHAKRFNLSCLAKFFPLDEVLFI